MNELVGFLVTVLIVAGAFTGFALMLYRVYRSARWVLARRLSVPIAEEESCQGAIERGLDTARADGPL